MIYLLFFIDMIPNCIRYIHLIYETTKTLLSYFVRIKGGRRRKHRKNRDRKHHNEEEVRENNGAGKLVEDHISVTIEEEKG